MILPCMTHWPKSMPEHLAGKPTHFPEKIWQSFPDEITTDVFTEYSEGFEQVGYGFDLDAVLMHPKKHTIREDKGDRWKAGNDIHFYITSRQKDMFQFAPVVKCVSVQKIEIIHTVPSGQRTWVAVDESILLQHEIENLAINDGFESIDDFFAFFNTDFNGKIIHWTDLKY